MIVNGAELVHDEGWVSVFQKWCLDTARESPLDSKALKVGFRFSKNGV